MPPGDSPAVEFSLAIVMAFLLAFTGDTPVEGVYMFLDIWFMYSFFGA